MKGDIRHIFFDLDRTLWDFEANSREALFDIYHSHGLRERAESTVHTFVKRYMFHNDQMWDLYRADKITKNRLRKERFRRALKDVGVEDSELTDSMSQAYIDVCPLKTKMVDGAAEMLMELRGHFHLHILTNGFQQAQESKLKVTGMAPFFEQVITSERASSRKPQPRIYKLAMRLTRARPHECLMVGDNLDIDVKGAMRAGWDAIHYNCDDIDHRLPAIKHLSELSGKLL